MEETDREAPAGTALDRREYDGNGWFMVPDNPLSKVGVFPYAGRSVDPLGEIGPAAEPDRLYGVYRPAEELSSPECIDSFKLLPWIDEHVMLGPEEAGRTPAEQKGIQGVIGEQVYFDGVYLRGNIKVMSEAMAGLIASGKRELSCGYACKYEYAPGVYEGEPYTYIQREIRGNHLALVESGRMGPEVAVMDAQSLDAQEPTMADEKTGGESQGMTLEDAKKHLSEIMPVVAELQKLLNHGGASEPVDDEMDEDCTMDADKDDTEKPGAGDPKPMAQEKATMDAAEIARNVRREMAEHADLYARLSTVVGAFDARDMSVAQMAAYGAEKLALPKKSRDYLEGYLAAQTPKADAMDAAPRTKGNIVQRILSGK